MKKSMLVSFFYLFRSQDIPVELGKISTMAALQLALAKFWYEMMRQGRIVGPQDWDIERIPLKLPEKDVDPYSNVWASRLAPES